MLRTSSSQAATEPGGLFHLLSAKTSWCSFLKWVWTHNGASLLRTGWFYTLVPVYFLDHPATFFIRNTVDGCEIVHRLETSRQLWNTVDTGIRIGFECTNWWFYTYPQYHQLLVPKNPDWRFLSIPNRPPSWAGDPFWKWISRWTSFFHSSTHRWASLIQLYPDSSCFVWCPG